jgi:hypothetical protein
MGFEQKTSKIAQYRSLGRFRPLSHKTTNFIGQEITFIIHTNVSYHGNNLFPILLVSGLAEARGQKKALLDLSAKKQDPCQKTRSLPKNKIPAKKQDPCQKTRSLPKNKIPAKKQDPCQKSGTAGSLA